MCSDVLYIYCMKKISSSLIFLILLLSMCTVDLIAQKNPEIFTIYLIRHSEKEIFSENQLDPDLTECGIKRSEYLSSFFEDIDIENVYSTSYLRTINTAAPTSLSKKSEIEYYDSNDLKLLSETLISSKQNSLVVGHSNTIPVLAGLLTDQVMQPFDESIYNRIYKVVINQDKKKLFIIKTTFNCK